LIIHDHYEGAAHCVECGGPCALTGDDLKVTNLIRAIVETAAFHGHGFNWLARDALNDLGVDVDAACARARLSFTDQKKAG